MAEKSFVGKAKEVGKKVLKSMGLNFTEELETYIHQSNEINNKEKRELLKKLDNLKEQKVNILIIGGTGVGKSSTINALFKGNVAKVGDNPSPETMKIKKFIVDENVTLWDSPGLGDGIKDTEHEKKIIKLLEEKNNENKNLIDCVLVIVDAGSKDLGTSFKLINDIIIPNLGEHPEKRIIIAINKADMGLSGRSWNNEKNIPEEKLVNFLDDKVNDIQERILSSTNVDIKPMYYSAGYSDEDVTEPPYNIDKLMLFILDNVPQEKALVTGENFQRENTTKDVVDKLGEIVGDVLDVGVKLVGGFFSFIGSFFK